MMRRDSILGLMGIVLIFAISLAALRNANEFWAGAMALMVPALIGTSVLGIIHRRGRDRAWWLGFAIFGGGYFSFTFGPWVSDEYRSKLGTSHLLNDVYFRVAISPPLPPSPSKLPTLLDQRNVLSSMQHDFSRRVRSGTDPALKQIQGRIARLDNEIYSIRGYTPLQAPPAVTSARALTLTTNSTRPNRWQTLLPGAANYDQFFGIGHCLFALLAGAAGAFISCRLHAGSGEIVRPGDNGAEPGG